MNIDFFTFIGPNSADYADYLKYTCETFVSRKHNINWKCIESVGAEKLPKGYKCVAKAPDVKHNSMNHGTAMNLALEFIESDYVVFIDADMAIVYQDWDDVIVKELNENHCFGVSYGHKTKYQNFPTVYLFAFRSYILNKATLDFRPRITPGKDSPLKMKLGEDAKYFNMKPGSILKCDTGFGLPIQIKRAGYIKSKSMPMVMMGSKNAQLPFENKDHRKLCMKKPSHMYEWQYNGKVFTTHKQASRTQPLDGIWGNAWRRRIDLYIERQKSHG
jgi:glycosyltransferase involved in cell wall biosynthesis